MFLLIGSFTRLVKLGDIAFQLVTCISNSLSPRRKAIFRPGLKCVFRTINSSDCKSKVTYQTTDWRENPTGGRLIIVAAKARYIWDEQGCSNDQPFELYFRDDARTEFGLLRFERQKDDPYRDYDVMISKIMNDAEFRKTLLIP